MRHQPGRKLPPLNAVRAFEAAARCGGFQAAGAELNVSANAVGRLVKQLEEWLELDLFRRLPRGVSLTEAGTTYLNRVRPLLDGLAEATTSLYRFKTSKILTVSAMPSFVARWLVPRLGRLTSLRSDLDVRVLASVPPTDFSREDVDLAVRLGAGRYEGLRSHLLLRERFFPVCSPKLLRSNPSVQTLAGLADQVLLHDEWEPRIPDQINWDRWFEAFGQPKPDANRGIRFSFSHMTLQAAANGQGVALASSALVEDELATGQLVRPLGDLYVEGPYAFHLVYPEHSAASDKVVAFIEWATSEANGAGTRDFA